MLTIALLWVLANANPPLTPRPTTLACPVGTQSYQADCLEPRTATYVACANSIGGARIRVVSTDSVRRPTKFGITFSGNTPEAIVSLSLGFTRETDSTVVRRLEQAMSEKVLLQADAHCFALAMAPMGTTPPAWTTSTHFLKLPAADGWTPTGVRVKEGVEVIVIAAGSWSNGRYCVRDSTRMTDGSFRIDTVLKRPYFGADGYAGAVQPKAGLPVAGAIVGSLIGRVGLGGKPFAVGSSQREIVGSARENDELLLAMNDFPTSLADNTGALSIELIVRRRTR